MPGAKVATLWWMAAADPPDDATAAAPPDARLAAVFERSFGGVLGVAESTLPAAAFVVAITVTGNDTRTAAIIAVALAAVLALTRIVRRQTPIYALSGVIGVAIAGYVAAKTGKAENFFLPGLLLNIAYAAAYAISNFARWPLVGVLVGAATGGGMAWRRDAGLVRSFARATWIWVGLFLARIAVQLPLYLIGATVVLGATRVAMGLPLFAVGLWLSYLVLRDVNLTPARPDPVP
jgi:hypothetical protein